MDGATLIETLRDGLLVEPDVEVAALFGSAARSRLGPSSDVDIYLRLAKGVGWPARRVSEVARALERAVRREVDLVVEDPDRTSTLLRMEVARHGKLILERRPGAWTDLRADAMVAYADLQPFMALCGAGVRRRVGAIGHG